MIRLSYRAVYKSARLAQGPLVFPGYGQVSHTLIRQAFVGIRKMDVVDCYLARSPYWYAGSYLMIEYSRVFATRGRLAFALKEPQRARNACHIDYLAHSAESAWRRRVIDDTRSDRPEGVQAQEVR